MKYRLRGATVEVRKKKKRIQRSSIPLENLKTQQNKISHKPSKVHRKTRIRSGANKIAEVVGEKEKAYSPKLAVLSVG